MFVRLGGVRLEHLVEIAATAIFSETLPDQRRRKAAVKRKEGDAEGQSGIFMAGLTETVAPGSVPAQGENRSGCRQTASNVSQQILEWKWVDKVQNEKTETSILSTLNPQPGCDLIPPVPGF